jgi:MoaA/NifB/PqqE/SkfB family radical SAM enzyme
MGALRHSNARFRHRIEDAGQQVKRMMLRTGFSPRPFRIKVAVTDRCNFHCPTCSKWKSAPAQEEMSAPQWRTAFRRLRGFPLMNEMTFGGGEPFMRPDILEVLESARAEGFYTVVISNGWNLTPDKLRELGRVGVNRLVLSLNSVRDSVHDKTRQAPGSGRHLLELIGAWTGFREPQLSIEAVIFEDNVAELAELARFVMRCKMHGLILQALAPSQTHYAFGKHDSMPALAPDWYHDDPAWVRSLDVLRAQMEELLALKRQGAPVFNPSWQLAGMADYYANPLSVLRMPCVGTVSAMHVDPLGNVRLCYGLQPIGNVLRDSPQAIWRGTAARAQRREKRSCPEICRILNENL